LHFLHHSVGCNALGEANNLRVNLQSSHGDEDRINLSGRENQVANEGASEDARGLGQVQSEGETAESDLLSYLSLKSMLLSATQSNVGFAVEEEVKNACCLAAFNLCEKPPGMSDTQFKSTRPRFLKRARTECEQVWTLKAKTEKQICSFYSTNAASCAYTPSSESDIVMYNDRLMDCCARASEFCETTNDTSFFLAKRDCFGFASRTKEEICAQAKNQDCTGASKPKAHH